MQSNKATHGESTQRCNILRSQEYNDYLHFYKLKICNVLSLLENMLINKKAQT